jgi:drug/metabolite transporter (DMT)-like permease
VNGTVVGMGLAFTAALALNGSYLMQHAGSVHAPAVDPRRPLRTLAGLLRSPMWALGAVGGMAGWMLHIGAMREAPLSIVQAFVAGGLVLAVPMAAIGLRQRLAPREVQAIGLMVLGLLLLALGLAGAHAARHFSGPALGLWMAALAVAAGALAARARGPHRPLALGLAGGLLYGAADLGLKAVTGLPGGGVLTSPWLPAALVATAGAFFAFQRGLQSHRPLAVIALMTTATNTSSIAGAFVVFGDPLGRTPLLALLHALAFAVIVAASWRLAPAQARMAGA